MKNIIQLKNIVINKIDYIHSYNQVRTVYEKWGVKEGFLLLIIKRKPSFNISVHKNRQISLRGGSYLPVHKKMRGEYNYFI